MSSHDEREKMSKEPWYFLLKLIIHNGTNRSEAAI